MDNLYVAKFRNIVINSLNLNERIDLYKHIPWKRQDTPLFAPSSFEIIWRKNFAGMPIDSFEKRLKWDDISKNDLAKLSSIEPLKFVMPKWADNSKQIVYYFESNAIYQFPKELNYKEQIQLSTPFLEIYDVLSNWGLSKLFSNGFSLKITDNAIADIKNDFVENISYILTPIFLEEFNSERYLDNYSSNNSCINKPNIIKRKFFFDWLKEGGLMDIFSTYPVLTRLIGEFSIKWADEYFILFNRLIYDSKEICKVFNIDLGNFSLNKIQSGLSDSHNGGQSVKLIQFSCGKSIIYKPKNIEIDNVYYDFINWFNNLNELQSQPSLKTICRRDYGWVEFLEYLAIKDKNELNRFYFNAGAFLCIAHILKITDCHYENLIANNEHLTLIDCETVMHPQVLLADDFASNKLLNKSFLQSIFRTGFLPSWSSHLNNKSVLDISGLGGFRHSNSNQTKYIWKDSSYDSVELIQSSDDYFQSNNQPLNKSFKAVYYLNEIQEGFEDTYRLLLNNQHFLLYTSNNLLSQFYNRQTRYIYRATEVYDKVIKYALTPQNLKHGLHFSFAIDILSRAHLMEESKTDLWKIYLHEFKQIHCLDIPIFYSNTSSESVIICDDCSIPFFEKSGYELSIETIKNLSEEDLAYQLNILQGALFASTIEPLHVMKPELQTKEREDLKTNENDLVDFLKAAEKIGEELIQRKNKGNDYNWLAMSLNSKSGRYQFGTLGYNLFDGLSGIGLFFAALYKATNNHCYKLHAERTVSPVILAFDSPNKSEVEKIIQYMGVGIAEGVGSIIYSLLNISEYINEPQMQQSALNISNSLTEEIIYSDKQFDIVSGNAGLLLSLLKLYRLTNNLHVSNLLDICGKYLFKSLNEKLDLFFKAKVNNPLTGFSHGAAGISYAMFRLYELTGDENYKTVAMKYLTYEKSQMDKEKFSYPDFRYEINNRTPNAWCHGVAGIFLSRVAVLKHITMLEEEYSEIEHGLNFLLRTQNFGADHVCCGNSGRNDILLTTGLLLNNQNLIKESQNRMKQLISNATTNGGYHLNSSIPKNFSNLGFFQGISGIGYQILRTKSPNIFKSVLLFE